MRPTRTIRARLSAAVLLGWPAAAWAAGLGLASAAGLGVPVLSLWAVSGLCLVLACNDGLRGERLSIPILLQAVFALLAAILVGGGEPGPWPAAARSFLYASCTLAVLGASAHVDALVVQWRLRRTMSLGQSLAQLVETERLLDELSRGRSERFDSVLDREAESIERLKTPGLAGLWGRARLDRERAGRMRSQIRYLDYAEQVVFDRVAGLLHQKEELLVHMWPHLKRNYLLDLWCDAQVCIFSATCGLIAVYLAAHAYY